MSFAREPRGRKNSAEGATLKRSKSTSDRSTRNSGSGRFNSWQRARRKFGSTIRDQASQFTRACRNFEPVQYKDERRHRDRSHSDASDSEPDDDGSSEGDESDASTAPSSDGSVTSESSIAESMHASGSLSSATKKKVEFRDPVPVTTWEDLTREEKCAIAKKAFPSKWASAEGTEYSENKLIGSVGKYHQKKEAATKRAESNENPTQEKSSALSKSAIKFYAKELKSEVARLSAYNGQGGITNAKADSIVRGLLPTYLGQRFSGSVNQVSWPDGWKDSAKPPKQSRTVALTTPEHRATHKRHILPTLDFTRKDGKEVTEADRSACYDREVDDRVVTIDPDHPLWTEFSTYSRQARTPDFAALDQDQKERLQEMWDEEKAILARGGTQAEVEGAWAKKYGKQVEQGQDYVAFHGVTTGTHRAEMGNGAKITWTCGRPSTPPGQLTVDMSRLGSNPFYTTDENIKKQDAENARLYMSEKPRLTEVKNTLEKARKAEQEARSKAKAKWLATPRPLPSKTQATCLSDMPDFDTAANLSWNGYDKAAWVKGATEVTKENASTIFSRILTESKIAHLLREKYPSLGKSAFDETPGLTYIAPGVVTAISTAMGDSQVQPKGQQAKVESEIPEFLAKHGVQTDAAAITELFNSTSRATAYTGQIFKDWATKPEGISNASKQLSSQAIFDRLRTQAVIAEKLRKYSLHDWLYSMLMRTASCKTPQQEIDISTFLTDKANAVATPEEYHSIRATIEKKLETDPSWAPDKTTDLG